MAVATPLLLNLAGFFFWLGDVRTEEPDWPWVGEKRLRPLPEVGESGVGESGEGV